MIESVYGARHDRRPREPCDPFPRRLRDTFRCACASNPSRTGSLRWRDRPRRLDGFADERHPPTLDHHLHSRADREPVLLEPPPRHSQVRHDGLGEGPPRDTPRGEWRTYGARAGRGCGSLRAPTGRSIALRTRRGRGRLSTGKRRMASDRREDMAHHLQVSCFSRVDRSVPPQARRSPPRGRG